MKRRKDNDQEPFVADSFDPSNVVKETTAGLTALSPEEMADADVHPADCVDEGLSVLQFANPDVEDWELVRRLTASRSKDWYIRKGNQFAQCSPDLLTPRQESALTELGRELKSSHDTVDSGHQLEWMRACQSLEDVLAIPEVEDPTRAPARICLISGSDQLFFKSPDLDLKRAMTPEQAACSRPMVSGFLVPDFSGLVALRAASRRGGASGDQIFRSTTVKSARGRLLELVRRHPALQDVRLEQIGRSFVHNILAQTGDFADTLVITNRNFVNANVLQHYYTKSAFDVGSIVIRALQRTLGTNELVNRNDRGVFVGSPRCPLDIEVQRLLKALERTLQRVRWETRNCLDTDRDALRRKHNAYVIYVLVALTIALALRPGIDPSPDVIDLEERLAAIDQKGDGSGYHSGAGVLAVDVNALVHDFHLWREELRNYICLPRQGSLPFFFVLDENLWPQAFHPNMFPSFEHDFALSLGALRRWVRVIASEMGANGEELAILLRHVARGRETSHAHCLIDLQRLTRICTLYSTPICALAGIKRVIRPEV